MQRNLQFWSLQINSLFPSFSLFHFRFHASVKCFTLSSFVSESNNLVSLSLSGNHLQTMTDVFCLIPETLQELNVSLCFPVRDSLQSNVDDVNLKQLKSLGLQGLPETEILNCVLMNDSLAKSLQTLDVSNSSADRESIVRLLR